MSPPPSEPTHNLEEVLAKAMAIEEQYKQSWSLTELELRIALLENALASEPGILNNHQASDKQSSLHGAYFNTSVPLVPPLSFIEQILLHTC